MKKMNNTKSFIWRYLENNMYEEFQNILKRLGLGTYSDPCREHNCFLCTNRSRGYCTCNCHYEHDSEEDV